MAVWRCGAAGNGCCHSCPNRMQPHKGHWYNTLAFSKFLQYIIPGPYMKQQHVGLSISGKFTIAVILKCPHARLHVCCKYYVFRAVTRTKLSVALQHPRPLYVLLGISTRDGLQPDSTRSGESGALFTGHRLLYGHSLHSKMYNSCRL